MLCSNCGFQVSDDARFCGNCGARFENAEDGPLAEGELLAAEGGSAAAAAAAPAAEVEREIAEGERAWAPVVPVKKGKRGSASDRRSQTAEDIDAPEVVSPDAIAYRKKRVHGLIPALIWLVVIVIVGSAISAWLWFDKYSPVSIDEQLIADEGLRTTVAGFDTDKDGRLSRSELEAVTHIEVEHAQSVAGLGLFPHLETLTVTGDEVVDVDVTDVPTLKSIDVSNTGVETLALRGCTALESIDAGKSSLGAIDLSGLDALATLNVESTPLKSIDISDNHALASLRCPDNTNVIGLDGTELKEYWLLSSYDCSTARGSSDERTTRIGVSYDAVGRIEKVKRTGSDGQSTATYEYNDEGHLLKMQVKQGKKLKNDWTFIYDDEGRLVTATDAASKEKIEYGYTSRGLLETYAASSTSGSANVRTRTFGYDKSDRLASISGDVNAALTYDDAGHLVLYEVEGDYSSSFEYDDGGRCITAMRWLQGEGSCTESFSYDTSGFLKQGSRSRAAEKKSFPYGAVGEATYRCDQHGNIKSMSVKGSQRWADTCNLTYTRMFTTAENEPTGMAPLLADPLEYTHPSSWYWAGWKMGDVPSEYDDAFALVFSPRATWPAGSNGS